jgi:hypothetical protein
MGWKRKLATGLGVVGLSVFAFSLDCAGRLGREVCAERLDHLTNEEKQLRQQDDDAYRFREEYGAAIVLCNLSKATECPEDAEPGGMFMGEPLSWTLAYAKFSTTAGNSRRDWCRFVSASEADAECHDFVTNKLRKTAAEFDKLREWETGVGTRRLQKQQDVIDAWKRSFECMSLFEPFSPKESRWRGFP